jgi:hypothetical protein
MAQASMRDERGTIVRTIPRASGRDNPGNYVGRLATSMISAVLML